MNTSLFSQFVVSLAVGIWSCLINPYELVSIAESNLAKEVDSTRAFSVQPFERIKITDAFIVNIKSGEQFTVNATGSSSDINRLDVRTKKGLLTITYKPVAASKKEEDVIINHEWVNITVTLPVLKEATFEKASKFNIDGFGRLGSVELFANSLASGTATLKAERLKLNLQSHAAVTLLGETSYLDADLQGQSELTAGGFKTRQAMLAVNGMSKANVFVSDKLQATASGSSTIYYQGKPETTLAQNDFSQIREYR
ncbi:DUF2807 domain-containing protein [Spirosoma sp. SC4-14]|uniref:GIN domain-containing protein n=1 Tax=Spirosoma sp. SC4-14 TaxID=3128900 RepID=UPI0030CD56DC